MDTKGLFKFSPLQGEFAKTHLSQTEIQDLKSVVILINGKTYRKAEGVLSAAFESAMEDDLVAANRYQLFGKRDTCRLPSPEERSRFIL